MKRWLRSEKNRKLLVILFFAVFFVYGCLVFKDYGISVDEYTQRRHSLVTYKAMFPSIAEYAGDTVDFKGIPSMEQYGEAAYYGVTMQLPCVAIEHLFGFNLDEGTVFYIRHFYNFLLFFIGAIYFYRTCYFFTKRRSYALLGTLMLIVSPRILADSFYNVKDSVCLSLCLISMFYCVKCIDKPRIKNFILMALFCALCANIRIVGAVVLASALIVAFIKSIVDGYWKKLLLYCTLGIAACFGVYIAFTPSAWTNTISTVEKIFSMFSNYTKMPGNSLYNGSIVTGDMLSRKYLFLWIGITTPVVYLLLFFIGLLDDFRLGAAVICKKQKLDGLFYGKLFIGMAMTAPIVYVVIFRPVLYNGWRHFYFIYGMIIINALFGLLWLERLLGQSKLRYLHRSVLAAGIIGTMIWIGVNHPYEYVYFNPFVRSQVAENYDRDYWAVSEKDALQMICDYDQSEQIKVKAYTDLGSRFLSKEDRERLVFVEDSQEADYVIEGYRDTGEKERYSKYYLYDEIGKITVDGYRICSVFKRLYDPVISTEIKQFTDSGAVQGEIDGIKWKQQQSDNGRLIITGELAAPIETGFFKVYCPTDGIIDATVELSVSEDGVNWTVLDENSADYSVNDYDVYAIYETVLTKYIRVTLPETSGQASDPLLVFYLDLSVKRSEKDIAVVGSSNGIQAAEASIESEKAFMAVDGDENTGWSSGTAQYTGMWFDIVMKEEADISGIELALGSFTNDYPRNLSVELSEDGLIWEKASVTMADSQNYIWEPQRCRYIRLQIGDLENAETVKEFWTINEIVLYSRERE